MAELHAVELRNAPVRLWHESRLWFDELLREFAVIDSGGADSDVPRSLLTFVEDVRARFSGFNETTNAELEAAQAAGRSHIDLRLTLPREAGEAAVELWNQILRAQEFCADGQLLVMPLSDRIRDFIRWYLFEVDRQLAGREPTPWKASDA